MCLVHAREFGAHGFDFGAVDRNARAAGAGRSVNNLEDSTHACGNRRQAADICLACSERAGEFCAGRLVEQFQSARYRVGRTFRIHRAGISRINEDQMPGGITGPDRCWERIKHRPQGFDVTQQLIVAAGKIQQFLLDATDVAQSQDGAAADGAAFRLDRVTGAGGQCHDKSATFAAQAVDRRFHAMGGGGLEPGTECENPFGHAAGRNDAGVAQNFGLLGCRCPGHKDLRLREQQRLEAIDLGLQCGRLVVRRGLRAACISVRPQQKEAGKQNKSDECKDQRQRVDLLATKHCNRAMDSIDCRRAEMHVGVSRSVGHDGKICGREGGEESVSPRTRTQPLVRRPDCLRHSGLPQDCGRRPPRRSANRWTLPLRGIAPKKSRP